jgi:hypothetical protein
MTVDQCYSILRFIVRKNQLGSLSPSDFQYAFNTAQRNYYDLLVGRIEQYRYDKPTPRIGLSMTDNVVSRLMPFQKSTSSSLIGGLFSKPSDFNKLLAMYTAGNYRVYRIEENTFAERIQDSIDPVNEANAFYVEEAADFRVYPSSYVGIITIKYLFSPTDVVWNYTTDGSGRPVYSLSGSTQPLWKDNDIDEILARAAKIVGVSLKEPILTQFGEQVIAKGE